MNGPERHQKSSLVSITLKILEATEGDSFFLPTFAQFNISPIPHLIQTTLQISRTPLPQTWPPLFPFLRSSHSVHPHISERWPNKVLWESPIIQSETRQVLIKCSTFLLPQSVHSLWRVPVLVSVSTQEHTSIFRLCYCSVYKHGCWFLLRQNHTCSTK